MKYKLIIYLLITSLLNGCVAVIVGTAAGMVVYDQRSLTMLESDARIFHLIHTRIVKDKRFSHSRIIAASFNEMVLLVGQTPAASLRELAEKIAQQTPHVKRIYNQITLGYPLPLSKRAEDTAITGQVRLLMLQKKGLESGSIRIVTENNTVYLMGIATHEQANLAVEVARHVRGVQKVVKIFQYIV